MKNKNDKRMFSWVDPRVHVQKASIYGKNEKGVFATEDIKKNEIIAIFGGYILKISDEEKLPKGINDYALQISENFVIGIKQKNEVNIDAYFNHSCNPNVGFKGQIFMVAMRNIKKGEEVTFDYAMVISKSKGAKYYRIKCLCGLKKCRGYVTEDDWKKPELQEKYKGYFQYYLQEKINKSKK